MANDKGYRVRPSSCADIKILVALFQAIVPTSWSRSDESRTEGGVADDRGNFSLLDLYTIDFSLSGKELANSLPDKQLQSEFPDNFKLSGNNNLDIYLFDTPQKRGPIADQKSMEIYVECFGGKIEAGVLTAPKEQSYRQVRNRMGFIYGLVAYQIGSHGNRRDVTLIEGVTFGAEYNNLSEDDRLIIIDAINVKIQSGDLSYER
jgi:hypothetical protein